MVARTAAAKTAKNNTAMNMAEITTKNRARQIPAPTKKAMDLFPEPSDTDVNGSYTGKPKNKEEIPVQDADDL